MFTEKACLIAGSLTFFAWGAALQKPLRKSKANHHDQLFADGDPFALSESIRSDNLPETYSFPIRGRAHSGVASPQAGPCSALRRRYSHSIVAGGLPEMSYTTRLMPRTSLMMRLETLLSSACGSSAQCAVMKSCVCTARSATTHS